MPIPNDKQITDQIAELKRLLPRIPPRTGFGDSNTDAIEAQIEVLEKRLTPQAVDDRRNFEDQDEDDSKWAVYVGDCAADAARWLTGETPEAPSVDWRSLAR